MSEYLETTVDKFTFRVATDRLYTPEGLWVQPEAASKRVRLGLSDYPQQQMGDVAFAHVKPVGTRLTAGELFAEIETIKTMLEMQAPISGTIAEVNPALDQTPEVLNQSPYEKGWLAMIEPTAWETERSKLLEASTYFALMQTQVQQELKKL